MSDRTRSEGWKYAKISGHDLEETLRQRLLDDFDFSKDVGRRIFGESSGRVIEADGGSSTATQVLDVFGTSTPPKPDLYLRFENSKVAKVSVKKSSSGQVFLTSVDRFCEGFRLQYGVEVPSEVQECLKLFIGPLTRKTIGEIGSGGFKGGLSRGGELQEIHQSRLVAATLEKHHEKKWKSTLRWLSENCGLIADFAFSRGYAKNKSDHATVIWYFITEEPSIGFVNTIIPIPKLVSNIQMSKLPIEAGPRNGGSTLQFPFGFLQMHSPKGENLLQFHHSYKKVGGI
jgi:hypothetical protein